MNEYEHGSSAHLRRRHCSSRSLNGDAQRSRIDVNKNRSRAAREHHIQDSAANKRGQQHRIARLHSAREKGQVQRSRSCGGCTSVLSSQPFRDLTLEQTNPAAGPDVAGRYSISDSAGIGVRKCWP